MQDRLAADGLDQAVRFYLNSSVTPSTRKAYESANRRFIKFCNKFKLLAYPADEDILCKFSSQLAVEGLAPSSIKAYLSAVRFCQLRAGFPDPRADRMPRLRQVQNGIKLVDARGGRTLRERRPFTHEILKELGKHWPRLSFDDIMVWAVCMIAFFGFFRAGELTVPSVCTFDPAVHLSVKDVSFDARLNPTRCCIHLKSSKTDQCRKGVDVFVGATGNELCPVRALVAYLLRRGGGEGFLFRYENGVPLTKDKFVSRTRTALEGAGLDAAKYAGHSFRIGAATTAASKGMPETTIKALGRWKSDAYRGYIRTSREHLAEVSRELAK